MARRYSSCTVVGDWFRCAAGAGERIAVVQAGNVAWLSHLLAPAVGGRAGALRQVMPSTRKEIFARQLGDDALFEQYTANPEMAWASSFDGDVPEHCFAELYDAIDHNSLVLGFEIPPVMRRGLAMRGFDYLSFHNHPLRFLKDLPFGVYSNAGAAVASLEAIACNPKEINRQAARFAARFARLDPVQARLPEDCPVLFGQTARDASLIAGGVFAGWGDYVEVLDDLLRNYTEVAFVRHPQAEWRVEVIELLRSRLGKTVIGVSGNSYPLIMSGGSFGPMATLSSSIGVEARAFGHDVRFLLADPCEKFAVRGLDNPSQIMLDHRLFEPDFWLQIMNGTGDGTVARDEAFYLGDNFVRGTLEGWSFNALNGDKPFSPMEKFVIPAAQATDAQLDGLANILSGASADCRERAIVEARRSDIALDFVPGPLVDGGIWRWDPQSCLADLPLVNGFSTTEEDGAWSEGAEGAIEIPIGSDPGNRLRIEGELNFSFFRGILHEMPALLLYVNGKPCSSIVHRMGDQPYYRLLFSAIVPVRTNCRFRIQCSHAASPRELRLGDDERVLGFIIHSIEVSARSDNRSGDDFPLRLWGFGNRPIEISSTEEHESDGR